MRVEVLGGIERRRRWSRDDKMRISSIRTFGLADRVKLLTERYTATLPKLSADVEMLSAKVDSHLKQMGFEWN
jgi:hypothetical protein